MDIAITLIIICVDIHVLVMVTAHLPWMIANIVIMDFARQRLNQIDVVSSAVALLVAMEQ
jgi:hypothetical protein